MQPDEAAQQRDKAVAEAIRQGDNAVADAIRLFESNPEFPRVQVWIVEQMEEAIRNWHPDARAFGTKARLEFFLSLFDIRARAYLELVLDIDTQNAFMVMLACFGREAWEQYTWLPFEGMSPVSAQAYADLDEINARVQRWTNEGYKRLVSHRNAQRESADNAAPTADKAASAPPATAAKSTETQELAGTPVKLQSGQRGERPLGDDYSILSTSKGAMTDSDQADAFVSVYEKNAKRSDKVIEAIKRKHTSPKKLVNYQDLVATIWGVWQIPPQDISPVHIHEGLVLLSRYYKGGAELDRVSCEAAGVDPLVLAGGFQTSLKKGTGLSLDSPSRTPDPVRPRRTPDLDSSRERLALVDTLARELAIVKQELQGYCTADALKRKHPNFTLWTLIEDSQVKALVDGEAFTPKAYAESLTLSKFGLTSRETLKKDRRKLRKAEKADRE